MAKLNLFHGTSTQNLKGILDKGLMPRKLTERKSLWKKCPSREDFVYLTNCYAGYFAGNAMTSKYKPVIFLVQVDTKDLYPDEDYIGQMDCKGEDLKEYTKKVDIVKHKHRWHKSLYTLGTVAHKGIIKPENIIDHRIIKDKEMIYKFMDASISLMNYKFCGAKYFEATKFLFNMVDVNPFEEERKIFETILRMRKKDFENKEV